ncbi:hypothetical protein ACFB49_16160 [Sphingomonas sp. DBB INV C78]
MPDGTQKVVTVDRHEGGLRFGRIALLAAAGIAVVAIGFQVVKSRETTETTAASSVSSMPPQADVATMITQLEKKLQENPADGEGWRMLGWAYYRTERFPDAVRAYRKATEVDPKDANGWSALGEAIVLSSPTAAVPADAEAAFRKALAIDASDPRARYFLGVKKDLAGDHQGAINDWIALLKDTPPEAPWEANVRQTILQSASQNKIDIAGRMPEPKAPASSAATAAIPGPTREDMTAASSLPPGQQDEMVRGMVDGLAAKLKADPKNADGWLRLMRSYMVLGDQKAAGKALADARTAFNGDEATLTRIGDGARQLGIPGA